MPREHEHDLPPDEHGTGDAPPPRAESSHGDERRGGHAGPWLITYSDMITLLMALFICIITFSGRSGGAGVPRKRAALLLDGGGSGVAAAGSQNPEASSVVWREVPTQPAARPGGTETPPRYSDPVQNATAQVLQLLETATDGALEDSWMLRLPHSLLFAADGQLSEAGGRLLQAIARNLRPLPYDVQVQTDPAGGLAPGIALAQFLIRREGFHPSRIGVGLQPATDGRQRLVWLTFARRSGE